MTTLTRAEAHARARRLRALTTDRGKLTGFGQVICHLLDMLEEQERPHNAHSAKSEAATRPGGSPCHCARLLPALKRWAEARAAWIKNDQSRDNVDEVLCSSQALEELAWEIFALEARR